LEWFFWLAASGISIGLVVSVKWVGLFAIALVGIHTIEDLWELLGDLKASVVGRNELTARKHNWPIGVPEWHF
jgi:dolichyl-phosphate-mannose--protein O-mannosyl transferase